MLFTTRSAAALGCFALLLQPLWPQSWVRGVVREKTAQGLRPLPRAFVALSTSSGELLAATRTDDQGRYGFVDLPPDRLALAASKPGFLTRRDLDRGGSSAILDCSHGCREAGLDFELSRGAVVAGIVSDALLEPVSRAVVSVRRVHPPASGEKPATGATDDRGRFRIAGLRAGKYTLAVQRRASRGRDEVLTKTFAVTEGEQLVDLALTLGNQELFRVAGIVSGIPFGKGYRTWVEIRPLGGPARARQTNVGSDGRFQFDSVIPGRYAASAAAVEMGKVERTDYVLEVLEVAGDTDGIVLQPVALATVAGTVEVAAGALPSGAVVRFTSQDGFGNRWTRFSGPVRQFQLGGLRPGVYKVEAGSTEFYVKGVKTGGKLESPDGVVLSPGSNRIAVIAAADQSQIFGVVLHPKTGQPVPHGRVTLRGDHNRYSTQADQAGRFSFARVIPGEYRMCAWIAPGSEPAENDVSWEQAACQTTPLPIEPSSKIQIDLPAVP